MIYILSWTTKKHQKTLSRPLHSKLKKIQGLAQKFKDFSRKNGIQGVFKDFPKNSRTFQDCARTPLTFVTQKGSADLLRTLTFYTTRGSTRPSALLPAMLMLQEVITTS